METPKEESPENNPQFYKELFKEDLYLVNEPISAPLPQMKSVEEQGPKPEPKKPGLLFSGNKNSSLLILYNYPNAAIPPADEAMLRKLVSAIGHDYDSILKLNMEAEVALEEVMEESKATSIISFGVPSVSAQYKMNELNAVNNRKLVVTHSVQDLEADINLKKTLWVKLQEVFKK